MRKIAQGDAFSTELLFAPDLPSGAISYKLFDNDGSQLLSQSFTPPVGAVSAVIRLDGTQSVVALGKLFENRRLSWTYLTIHETVNGSITYRVDAPLAFGVSYDGVRVKLGVLQDEVTDDDIDLVGGYLEFASTIVNTDALTAAAFSGDRTARLVIDGIEAAAAFALLNTLQVKIAVARSSGTNTFERSSKIDFQALQDSLLRFISLGRLAVDVVSSQNKYNVAGVIFALSTRTDPLTGA